MSDSLTQVTSVGLNFLKKTENPEPDATRTVPELIQSRGFQCEEYDVTTEDGFILKLHRIVNPLVSRITDFDPKPILLGHGIAAHAGHWLINSEDGHLDPSFLHEVLNREARRLREERIAQQNKEKSSTKQGNLNDNQETPPDYSEKENNNNLRNYLSNGSPAATNGILTTKSLVNNIKNGRSHSTIETATHHSKINKTYTTTAELNHKRINSRASFSYHHERKRSSLPYKVPDGLLGNKPDLKASNNLGFLLTNLG
jgi:hypothetical protein